MNKLSTSEVKYIKDNYIPYDKDFSGASLARKFGVSRQVINKIVHGEAHNNTDIIYMRKEDIKYDIDIVPSYGINNIFNFLERLKENYNIDNNEIDYHINNLIKILKKES